MWTLADRLLDEFIAEGRCDFVQTYGRPFPLLVIADLLGVPEDEHPMYRRLFGVDMGSRQRQDDTIAINPPANLDQWFTTYIEDRRREPRNDIPPKRNLHSVIEAAHLRDDPANRRRWVPCLCPE